MANEPPGYSHAYQTRELEPGVLLLATPSLSDPNFAGAVVIILDHDDEGTLGVILNRPTAVAVASVLPEWAPGVSPPEVLFEGGPVNTDAALALAAVPPEATDPLGYRRVAGELGMIDLDTPPEVLQPGITNLRIYAGYSGWGPGQLAGELAEGAWLVLNSRPDDLFAVECAVLWQTVIRRQSGGLAWISTKPADPGQN